MTALNAVSLVLSLVAFGAFVLATVCQVISARGFRRARATTDAISHEMVGMMDALKASGAVVEGRRYEIVLVDGQVVFVPATTSDHTGGP